MTKICFYSMLFLIIIACQTAPTNNKNKLTTPSKLDSNIVIGAEQIDKIINLTKKKSVAMMVNQTSMVNQTHLVDTLLTKNVAIKKIFAPEHGFRGDTPDGETVKNYTDTKTGLPIISLYGKNKKPTKQNLSNIDIIIYDIQDVGLRFYTYISSMHYLMEAAAENNKSIIVLDRPNPNGMYVDGPIRDENHKSFVGMHPVPILYSMTVAEYAKMINNEGWLENGAKAKLTVIKMINYYRNKEYILPIPPSPNLPNQKSITLYPSLCLFEGTIVSIGRGTEFPFQVIGYPNNPKGNFKFTPKKIPGKSLYPKFENTTCNGTDLRNTNFKGGLSLQWLINTYKNYPNKSKFFKPYFNTLAGNSILKKQIENGHTEEEIKACWKQGLDNFKEIRAKYLIYK